MAQGLSVNTMDLKQYKKKKYVNYLIDHFCFDSILKYFAHIRLNIKINITFFTFFFSY